MKRGLVTTCVGLLVLVSGACGSSDRAGGDRDSACLAGATDCADDPTQDTAPDPDSACLVGATDCADDPTFTAP